MADAAYGVRFGNPNRPAADERLAMLGLALDFNSGIARCAPAKKGAPDR